MITANSAIVIIDMWDNHQCEIMVAELEKLIPQLNKTTAAARLLGMPVVFGPADVLDKYKDTPQRKRTEALPPCRLPGMDPKRVRPPPPPRSGWARLMPGSRQRRPGRWTRQHPDVVIGDEDWMVNDSVPEELYNLCVHAEITHLFYTGVATNMCIPNTGIGMERMTNVGMECYIISDLTAAFHGLPQDPSLTPAQVTAEAVSHLARYYAGSIESRELIEAAGRLPGASEMP